MARDSQNDLEGYIGICSPTLQATTKNHSGGRRAKGNSTFVEINYGLQTDQHFCRPMESQVRVFAQPLVNFAAQLHLLGDRSAYFNTSLGGCSRPYIEITRWILAQDQNSYVPMKSRIYGCTPETCSGYCDKSCMGIYIGGHFFRLANCPFGHATSNGPLSILTDAVLRQMSKRRKVDGSCYVDDFLFLVTPASHEDCVGLANGLPTVFGDTD